MNKKIKILYLITQSEWGGTQKYVYDLATHLDKNKYEIVIGVGRDGDGRWPDHLKKCGFKVYKMKHLVRDISPWHDFLSAFELYALLVKTKPDIVHLNSSKVGSTGAVVAWLHKKLHRKKIKIIYTAHGFVFAEPLSILKRQFYLLAEKISGRSKDKIICVSEFDKIVGLNARLSNHKKFLTIHNGLDLKSINFLTQDEARKKMTNDYQLPTAEYWIGAIANLYSNKGLDCLIRSAKNIFEKNPNIIFVIIGEGPKRKELEQQIAKMNLTKNFFLVGALAKAPEYLKAFDIFGLSSVKEGFPYALIEALAAGLPIVATSVGGVLEIIEPNVNGLIVPPKRPGEFANQIQNILDHPELQENFKRNNLIKARKFSLEKMIEETERVYEE